MKDWTTEGGETSWAHKLLNLAKDNILTQWLRNYTRYWGNEEPSWWELVFTKEVEILENLQYMSLLGKNNHVLFKFRLKGGPKETQNKDYKDAIYN